MRRAGRLICDRLFAPLGRGGAVLCKRCKVLIALMLLKWRSLTHNTWPAAPAGSPGLTAGPGKGGGDGASAEA